MGAEAGGLGEMELVDECGRVECCDGWRLLGRRQRGTRYLWESALHVVIRQARDGPSAVVAACSGCLLAVAKRGRCDSARGWLAGGSISLPQLARPSVTGTPRLAGQVDLAHHNTLASPYKLAPPPDSSEQSIVSTLHARPHTPSPAPAHRTHSPPQNPTKPPQLPK
jgi:hypothetical protein